MSALSILIVSGIFPPDHGGPATYVPEIANALVARGHRVVVVCLSDQSEDDAPFPFPVRRIRRGLFKPWRAALTTLAIARAARNADVVFVNGLELEAWLATAATATPRVHKIVGDAAWERARNRGWFHGTLEDYQAAPKSPVLRALDWLRARPLRGARAIFVPSNYLRAIVESWKVGAVAVVRNAAVIETAPAECREHEPLPAFAGCTIVTVCRLVPWKGLEALVRVASGTPEWRLVIVGDGPLRAALESQARAAAAGERILLKGAVSHARALAILRSADVFVLNSSYEGLPHVVLEAMAEGVPVVATRAGGTPELVIDGVTGRLVSPDADDELRSAIQEILADRERATRFAAAARERIAADFGFARLIDETERILLSAANQRRSSRMAST
jgi:glycosyltransferase involved in cell wall biosynthesis